MFNREKVKDLGGLRNYIKAERYLQGGRISDLTVNKAHGLITIGAWVRGADTHNPNLTFNEEDEGPLRWSCTCQMENEFCSHLQALCLYYLTEPPETMGDTSHKDTPAPGAPFTLTQRGKTYTITILTLSQNSRDLAFLPSHIKGYGSMDFITLKITDDRNPEEAIRVDENLPTTAEGAQGVLLEFIGDKGFYHRGIYYLGQSSMDMLFSLLAPCKSIYFNNLNTPLSINQDPFKPTLYIDKDRGKLKKDFLLIPGKYSNYAFKDNQIARLPKAMDKNTLKNLEEGLTLDDTEKLKEYFHLKPVDTTSPTIMEDPLYVVNIYLDYDEPHVIITPRVLYENTFSFLPILFFERTQSFFTDVIQETVEKDGEKFIITRNIHEERNIFNYFDQWPLEVMEGTGAYTLSGDEDILLLFNEIIPGFPPRWKIFYDKEIENLRPVRSDISFNFDVLGENGLLEFNIKFHLDRLLIDEDTLLNALAGNGILKHNGAYVEITNKEELNRLFSLLKNMTREDESYSCDLNYITELKELFDSKRCEFSCDETIKELLNALKHPSTEPVNIPGDYLNILRNYQKEGVNWMGFLFKYGFGGILADDMGLGKTLQTIVSLASVKRPNPSLIVAPKTLMFNWENEMKKFAPQMEVITVKDNKYNRRRLIANAGAGSIIITSYPLLQRDIQLHMKKEYDFLILDEAQHIKNPKTLSAKSVKLLKSKRKLALTGTPLENSLLDLWSVFDFVMPGFLGKESDFRKTYMKETGETEALKGKIGPFLLRRTKGEVLKELPEKIEQVHYSSLTKEQLVFYMDMLSKVKKEIAEVIGVKGIKNSKIEILAGLTRLRQICNHPGLVDPSFMDKRHISGKTDLFEELIVQCTGAGHRVLVFSQFTKMLDILGRLLTRLDISHTRLDGKTKNRRETVEEFTSNTTKQVFLISLKAGGYGLNLTCADTVIMYDPWWNPMAEAQAADRAHRIGQDKVVNVYSLITEGTIEEKIQGLKQRKQDLFDRMVTPSGDLVGQLNEKDLMDILSLDI